DETYMRRYYAVGLEVPRRGLTGRARKLGAKLGLLDPAPGKAPLTDAARRGHVTSHLRLADERVSFVDHHACHAAAAYFGSPYAPAVATRRAATALGAVFAMTEGRPSRFEWRRRGPLYRALLEATLGLRFDGIAGGAQQILEEALVRWARLARDRYGGERLALGGGVFMNVKANMLIAE